MKWLADDEYNVRRSYREIIHQAYEAAATIPADPIPQAFKDHQFEIRGIVKTGADQCDCGAHGTAPLRIDGRNGHRRLGLPRRHIHRHLPRGRARR
ncbi:hypothetical protein AB0O76_43730 [Streptomyces sp. NPDC086554]|uniref:hypothetical protein n=1 Tax=Streptomyces sp. NPDC086554 TaxID=3154864 RepID=UPI00343EB6B1